MALSDEDEMREAIASQRNSSLSHLDAKARGKNTNPLQYLSTGLPDSEMHLHRLKTWCKLCAAGVQISEPSHQIKFCKK